MIDRQTFVRDSIGPYFYFPTAGSFCDEYQAVINRAVAEGIRLPSPARQRLDNRKILRMQDEYLWNDLDVFFSFHTDADPAFTFYNWKNASLYKLPYTPAQYSFIPLRGMRWLANALTGYTPGTRWTINDASFFWAGDFENNQASSTILNTTGTITCTYFPSTPYHYIQFMLNDASARNQIIMPLRTAPLPRLLLHFQRSAAGLSRVFLDGLHLGVNWAQAATVLPGQLQFATGPIRWRAFGAGASLIGKEQTLNRIINANNL